MAGVDEVKAQVQARIEARDLLATVAERVGGTARASAVFGEPVERAGITVVPVAKASWGFGAGGGEKTDERGFGGGGGTVVAPIGYIEVRDSGAEFKPIRDPRRAVAAGAVAAGLAALALSRLRR